MARAELIRPDEDVWDVKFPDEKPEELTAAEKAANAAIEQLNDISEKGKIIRIYRQLGSGKESMQFVEMHPADKYSVDFLIEKIQREYGGGDYRFMIYDEKGKLAANKLISIAMKIEKNDAENGNIYSTLNYMMNKQQEFFNQFMQSNQANGSRMEFLQEMMIMKQLFDKPASDSDPIAQFTKFMALQKELKETMNDNDEDKNGFGSIIRESLPLLTTMAQAASGQVQQPRPVRPAPNVRQRKNNPTNNGVDPEMKMAVDHLIKLAEQKQSTGDVADEIITTLPERFLPQIEAIALTKNPVDHLARFNVDANLHKEWLLDLCEWLKAYFGHPSKYASEFDDDLTSQENSDDNSEHEPNNIQSDGDTQR